MQHNEMQHSPEDNGKRYQRLVAMTLLSFISMYILMYAMVNELANVYPNFNQFYMAGLMTAPMVVIELALMGAMYKNTKLNALLMAIGGIAFFMLIRQQTAISDEQFLKSMIPHHAGAILMCQQASLQGAEVKELCKGIMSGQASEIIRMKALLSKRR